MLLWLFLNLNDDDCSKSLTFFHVNICNIVYFQIELNVMWKSEYLDSENFVWNNDHKYKKAVNLYMIDWLSWLNFINVESLFDSSYWLQLQLNSMTVSVLKHILDNDFLKNIKIFRFFLLDYSIIFSSKTINFRKNISDFDFKNSFLFFFDERKTHL